MGLLTAAARRSAVRSFIAPSRYVQGPGVIDHLGELVAAVAHPAVVLVDELVMARYGERLRAAFHAAGLPHEILANAGEVTQPHIDAQARAAASTQARVVVAVGGGKTLDTGKGMARALGLPVVTVPTIASNDGPTSRVIALYDEQHRMVGTPAMATNPVLVAVDTAVIAAAPAHFLVSGIGDAVAKRFEAAACSRGSGTTSTGSRPLTLPGIVAEGCFRVLTADAAAAVADLAGGQLTDAVERVVEAVVLMSGLAFENGGLSLAHSLTRGLMTVPGPDRRLHGFHVAYGLLVQLQHEGVAAELTAQRSFNRTLGLPTSLRDLGAVPTSAVLRDVVAGALTAPHLANCVPVPTTDSLLAAISAVEMSAD